MLIFDILAVAIVCLLASGGYVVYVKASGYKKLKTSDGQRKLLRDKGTLNLEMVKVQSELTCELCGDPVSADVDIYIDSLWFHKNCILKKGIYR